MRFATELTVTGPLRAPAQMLAEQEVDGHTSVHDGDTAASLGLLGAPIEGPTHFSQFDPMAVALWGPAWFERGCLSSHFRTMVVEGEEVQANQGILVMEAMKMQNEIRSDRTGRVIKLAVAGGETVGSGDLIAIVGK